MPGLTSRELLTVFGFAAIGWAACAATMGIGMALTTMDVTLVIHAIGAPIYFTAVSWFYFRRLGYTGPLTTAVLFTGFVIVVDFFLVALLINRSLDMFRSFLGTWLPFMLIFAGTWVTGKAAHR